MEIFYVALLAAPILLIGVLAFLAVLVVGIRRADRASLRNSSGRVDSMTRRLPGGVHHAADDDPGRVKRDA